MATGPSYFANNPVSGVQYYAPMGYGCIANNGTTVTCTVNSWSGINGTGSLRVVDNLKAVVWNQTSNSQASQFNGNNFYTVSSNHTAGNSTDWYKPSGVFTGPQSVGSLEMFVTYTGSAFVPSISSLSASFGNPGDVITITGSHFTDASSVAFNGTAASFSITNDTHISATVPSGATSGNVTVSNASGTATSGATFIVGVLTADDGTAWQTAGVTIYGDDGAAWQDVSAGVQVWADDGSSWHRLV